MLAISFKQSAEAMLFGVMHQVPIYFSGAMASRANQYYRLLVNWTSERVKSTRSRATAFGFQRLLPWDESLLHQPVSSHDQGLICVSQLCMLDVQCNSTCME